MKIVWKNHTKIYCHKYTGYLAFMRPEVFRHGNWGGWPQWLEDTWQRAKHAVRRQRHGENIIYSLTLRNMQLDHANVVYNMSYTDIIYMVCTYCIKIGDVSPISHNPYIIDDICERYVVFNDIIYRFCMIDAAIVTTSLNLYAKFKYFHCS